LIEKKMVVLISNIAGEYTSNEFRYFCKDAGIKKENTISYDLQ